MAKARSAGTARRTNWLGAFREPDSLVVPNGETRAELVFPSASPLDTELRTYVDPTLIKTVGNLIVDPEVVVAFQGSQVCYMGVLLIISPMDPTAFFAAANTPTDLELYQLLSSDRIIFSTVDAYSAAYGVSQNGGGGATSWTANGYYIRHAPLEVDTSSMRKMGDDEWPWLVWINYDDAAGIDAQVGYQLRLLFKE